MKRLAMFCLLAVAGILLGVLAGFTLGRRLNPQRDWRELAQVNTMPNRRAYTLPLNNPDMIPAREAKQMRESDVVLGMVFHGEARAYPWWLVSNYHVVNDTVQGEPLLITLCEICGGAAAFRPVVPDLPDTPPSHGVVQ